MTEGLWISLIGLAGAGGTAIISQLWRDRRAAREAAAAKHREAVREAEERAYERARLEAIAREAEAALAAKDAELAALRDEHARCLQESER